MLVFEAVNGLPPEPRHLESDCRNFPTRTRLTEHHRAIVSEEINSGAYTVASAVD